MKLPLSVRLILASTLRCPAARNSVVALFTVFMIVIMSTRLRAQSPPIVLAGPISLPTSLSGQKIQLNFQPDATTGVRLDSLIHFEGGAFTFVNDPIGVGKDGRLWEVRGSFASSPPNTFVVSPSSILTASAFTAYNSLGPNGQPARAFVWDPVPINGSNALRVVLQVYLGMTDNVSHWRCQVTRVPPPPGGPPGTLPSSIDEIDFPIVYFNPPIVPVAGETLLNAQKRARLLIPENVLITLPSSNLPLQYFLAVGNSAGLDIFYNHPDGANGGSSGQTLQFAALYVADPAAGSGFRKMLYMGSEDTTGYYKTFRYTSVKQGGGTVLRFGWRATSFPPYATIAGVPSQFSNEFLSPYPVTLGALLAKDDAFWYDACLYYRSFVDSSGMAGPKLSVNTNLGKSKGPAIIAFHNQLQPLKSGIALYQRFLDITRAWQVGLTNPYTNANDTFMHWQAYLTGGVATANPDYPVPNSIDSGVTPVLAAARSLGIYTEAYTIPGIMDKSSNWFTMGVFPPIIEGFDKYGQPNGGSGVADIDLGVPLAHTWFTDNVISPLIGTNIGFSGVYLDILSGSGTELSYDPPGLPPQHIANGGNYYEQGKVALIDYTRSRLQSLSPFAPPGGTDPNVIITSEAAEEYLTSHFDFVGHGYDWMPGHMTLAEDLNLGPSGAPPITTDWSAPLWNTVYHEWQPDTPLGVPFSSLGLATNPTFWDPITGFQYGMTAQEWTNLFCYCHSCMFINGARSSLLTEIIDTDWPMVSLNAGGNLTVNPLVDPNQTGLTIMSMLATLYQSIAPSFAGPWLLSGKMLRPLHVSYTSSEVEQTVNPTSACLKGNPQYPVYYFPGVEVSAAAHFAYGPQSFSVSKVLHSAWKDSQGNVAIILVNWTGSAASWAGTFDPTLFEFPAGVPRTIGEISINGGSTTFATVTGPITIHANKGTSAGGNVYIGKTPPRTVRVLIIQ
ncbi:MAG: hypothetical protein HY286_12295 [Planctomycetes bacterium]|nr:hypothetical protein [Planctomycetota bacterium]